MDQEKAYLCPNGHQVENPGLCPRDGKTLEAAHYICRYCGYATHTSKTEYCPNCEAKMLKFTPRQRQTA
jgi:rubrerythrin